MAETVINKNQAGSGIWTSDSLVAGNNISITQVQQPLIDANTVGLYHFNGDLKDEISGNNATPYDAQFLSYSDEGKFDKALYCNNSVPGDFYSNIALVNFLSNQNSYTFDFWIRLNTTNNVRVIFFRYSNTNTYRGITFNAASNRVILEAGFNGTNYYSGSSTTIDGITDIAAYNWIHVAYVWDAPNNGKYLFINGKKVWSLLTDSGAVSFNYFSLAAYQQYYFRIDELRLSNVARWTSDFTPFTQPYQLAGGAPQYAINSDLTSVVGYDSSKTQVLKNVNGTLTWVDEA